MSLSADAVYRILIVDDSTEDREIFKRYLTQRRQLTYAFSEAETIEAGLKCFAESPPACVLLDYLLPDGNGLEFLERVASEFPPHEIRVVMLTGYGDEAVIVTAMKMGAMDYLSKGQLNADALNRVVYSAIEKGSTLAALAVANARATKMLAELERSNEDLEQFAYVASHDLREPLSMVSSYLQLLQRRYQGQLDSEADEFIEISVKNAARMRMLIDDLLEYARLGTRGDEFGPTDCNAVLDQVVINLQVTIEKNAAKVTHDPLPSVLDDPQQLTQVFQNLIGNALKFRNQQTPVVHISVKKKSGESKAPADWTFTVQDNGIGLDPEFAERIFTIFQRLHTREEYSGTGIGLAICKKIVDRHNGRIWVESEVGKGTTFYFTLPELAAENI